MISTALAAAGYRVIAIARHETAELRAAAAAASEAQRGALEFRAFDLAQIGAIAKLAASLHEEYGPLYGLVNNAGIGTTAYSASCRTPRSRSCCASTSSRRSCSRSTSCGG